MFSTMMTEESTMMPKSTAPMDSRFADLPRKNSIEKANNSASGMLMATMMAVRMLLTNMNRITTTSSTPDQQVFRHGLGGDVEQIRAVVIGLDLHAGQPPAGCGVVEFLDFLLDVLQGGQGVLVLAHQHDALHHVVLVVADVGERKRRARRPLAVGLPVADPPEARLVADHDALLSDLVPGTRPPSTTSSTRTGWLLTEAITRLRMSRMRRYSSRGGSAAGSAARRRCSSRRPTPRSYGPGPLRAVELALVSRSGIQFPCNQSNDPRSLGRRTCCVKQLDRSSRPASLSSQSGCVSGLRRPRAQHLVHRIHAAAEQADAAHGQGDLALVDVIAAHGGIAVGQRLLKLGQRDAVAAQAVRVGLDLVAPDGAAETGEVHDARHGPELALHHPVLHRLDVVERVNRRGRTRPWETFRT